MDLEIIESLNGGDILKKAKDFSVIYGFENMPYLALFGGNIKASTPSRRLATEQAFDFWGNNLFMQNDASIQFNSDTEKTLNSVALNSSGRIIIENAIKKDLVFMSDFAIIKVATAIVETDKILIGIQAKQPDNLQVRDFMFIWDATRQELFDKELQTSGGGVLPPSIKKLFDFTFDFTFN